MLQKAELQVYKLCHGNHHQMRCTSRTWMLPSCVHQGKAGGALLSEIMVSFWKEEQEASSGPLVLFHAA
jgi:hypothetical protein